MYKMYRGKVSTAGHHKVHNKQKVSKREREREGVRGRVSERERERETETEI